MLVLTQSKRSVWKFDKGNFIKAEVMLWEKSWRLMAYRAIDNPKYSEHRVILGDFETEEKAKEQLKAFMVALDEDTRYVVEEG